MFKEYEDHLYRYEDQIHSTGLDDYGESTCPGILVVELNKYGIIRKTPKGAWIDYYGEEKFVLLTARKKFACDSKEDAIKSFTARKNAQKKILKAKLHRCKASLVIIKNIQNGEDL